VPWLRITDREAHPMPDSSAIPVPETDTGRPRGRARARVRYNIAMKWVRRTHMYAGLFLVPWVFLYGISAFLFNHPDAFPDREVRAVSRSEAAGTPLEGLPDADRLAARVVAALNARSPEARFRLDASAGATLSRPLTVTATGRGREHSVRYDLDSGTGTVRSTAAPDEPPRYLPDGEVLRLEDSPRERLAAGVPALLGRIGIEADAVTVRNPPDLVFDLEADDGRWRVAYNLQTERLSIRRADDPSGRLSSRRFLTGLHLAFGYPSRVGPRWLWALVVDVMAAAMIAWGTSGLMMWWQMKSVRRWGAVALGASLVAASLLGVGMHAVLAR
jgi:hypothetical protein